jgi:CHASE2 domain-containing sensor protein
VFDERDGENLRDNPLTRQEADEVYRKRRSIVVFSYLWLLGLALACAALGFAGWLIFLVVAALATFMMLPVTLYVFRSELDVQVRSGDLEES